MQSQRLFLLAYALAKFIAIVAGAMLCLFVGAALMAPLGIPAPIRLGVAGLVVAILSVVLILLSPKSEAGSEVATDVLAVGWVLAGAGLLAFGPLTVGDALRAEAATLDSDHPKWSDILGIVAGGEESAAPLPIAPAAPPSAPFASISAQKDQDPAAIFESWAPSVVQINVKRKHGTGTGTGFVVDARGTVVTNDHVIKDAEEVTVKFLDGTEISDVAILHSTPDLDLAILDIKPKTPIKAVVLGTSDNVIVGERVVSIGNPLGLEHSITDGIVSSRRIWEGRKVIQMSAPVSPGNSGGPVFNLRGEVVGVTFARVDPVNGENLNLAVPVDLLKPLLAAEHPDARHFGRTSW